jgi:hypothetical protein
MIPSYKTKPNVRTSATIGAKGPDAIDDAKIVASLAVKRGNTLLKSGPNFLKRLIPFSTNSDTNFLP